MPRLSTRRRKGSETEHLWRIGFATLNSRPAASGAGGEHGEGHATASAAAVRAADQRASSSAVVHQTPPMRKRRRRTPCKPAVVQR